MTIITIKQTLNLPQTEFETLEDLTQALHDYSDQIELPKLTTEEIAEAQKARNEWKENPQLFSRVSQ